MANKKKLIKNKTFIVDGVKYTIIAKPSKPSFSKEMINRLFKYNKNNNSSSC